MSNALSWVDGIREKNCVIDATDPGRQPVVDPYDIARIAALALTEGRPRWPRLHSQRPEALTAREQVGIISDVLGARYRLRRRHTRAVRTGQHRTGYPDYRSPEAMKNLNELSRAGRAGVIADDIENLTGRRAANLSRMVCRVTWATLR